MSDEGSEEVIRRLLKPFWDWAGTGQRWILACIIPVTPVVYWLAKEASSHDTLRAVLTSPAFWILEFACGLALFLVYRVRMRPLPADTYRVAIARFKCIADDANRRAEVLRELVRKTVNEIAKARRLPIRCILSNDEFDPVEENFEKSAAGMARNQPCDVLVSARVLFLSHELVEINPAVTSALGARPDYLGAPQMAPATLLLAQQRFASQDIATLALLVCGLTALYRERYDDAIQLFELASPVFPEADLFLGIAYLGKRAPADAVMPLKRASVRRPAYSEALYFLSVAASDLNDQALIDEVNVQLKSVKPIDDEPFRFYKTLYHLKRFAEVFTRIVDNQNGLSEAIRGHILVQESQDEWVTALTALDEGKADQARKHALRALELDPSNLLAVKVLAKALIQLGEPQSSVVLLDQYEKRLAAVPRDRGDLAAAYLAAGQKQKALTHAKGYLSDATMTATERNIWPTLVEHEFPNLKGDPTLQMVKRMVEEL